jgi:putative transposase
MRRHTPEQVIAKLRQAEADLAQGLGLAQVCQKLGVSEPTLHRWRNQYGGMKADEAKRLRELEAEDARLKRLVAELALDRQMLREVAQKKWWPPASAGRPSATCGRLSGPPNVAPAGCWGSRAPPSARPPEPGRRNSGW